MSFDSHLQTSITVQAPTKVMSQMKAVSRVWTDVAEQGMIEQLQGNELVIMGRLGKMATHRLYCRTAVTIDTGYRVVADGITYEVEGRVDAAGITRRHHQEIMLIHRG